MSAPPPPAEGTTSPTRGRGRGGPPPPGAAGRGRGGPTSPPGGGSSPSPPNAQGVPPTAGGTTSPTRGRGRGGPIRGGGGPAVRGRGGPPLPPNAAGAPSSSTPQDNVAANSSPPDARAATPTNFSRRPSGAGAVPLPPAAAEAAGAQGLQPVAPPQGTPAKSPTPTAGKKSPSPAAGKKSPSPGGKKSPMPPTAAGKSPTPTGAKSPIPPSGKKSPMPGARKSPVPTAGKKAPTPTPSSEAADAAPPAGEGGAPAVPAREVAAAELASAPAGEAPPLPPTPPRTPPPEGAEVPPLPPAPPSEPPSAAAAASTAANSKANSKPTAGPAAAAAGSSSSGGGGTAICKVIVAIDPELTGGVDWRTSKLIIAVQMNQRVKNIVQSVQTRYRVDDLLDISVPVTARGKDIASMQPNFEDVIHLDLTPVQLGWKPETFNWVWFRAKLPRDDQDPNMQQKTEKMWYLDRVRKFYEFYDPRKLNTSESVLEDFENSYDLLIVQLVGRYGKEPTKEMLRQNKVVKRIDLDATPQSILQDRVTGRDKEDEREMEERKKKALALQAAESSRAGASSRKNQLRNAGGDRGGGHRLQASDPELRRQLELLFARNDNEKTLRILYFRKWFQFLSFKRARAKISEFLSTSSTLALYRTYYDKFKMFRLMSTMGKQMNASNIAAHKSDSLVADLQADNTFLKGEVKKLQTQVELLDSTNARRLETLCNSSELAINQIKALTQECQTKEQLIVKLEQKLMGIGTMALAAGEKKDFALQTAIAARMEMEEKFNAASQRAAEIETAYTQAQNEIRRLKKKSEMRKQLLSTAAVSAAKTGVHDEATSSEDESGGVTRRRLGGRASSSMLRAPKGAGGAGDHGGDDDAHGDGNYGQHASATIALIQKECKHCVHYAQQKFVIDSHQKAADEMRDRIEELEQALQKVQNLLNTVEDENTNLRRQLQKGGGGGGGNANAAAFSAPSPDSNSVNLQQQQSPRIGGGGGGGAQPTRRGASPETAHSNTTLSPLSPYSNVTQQQQQQGGGGGGGFSSITSNMASQSHNAHNANAPPSDQPPIPASIRALLGNSGNASMVGVGGGSNTNNVGKALAAGLGLTGSGGDGSKVVSSASSPNGGHNNMSTMDPKHAAIIQATLQSKSHVDPNTAPLLQPFKTYEGSSNPTWGYGVTSATPTVLTREDPLYNNVSAAPPRYTDFVLSQQQEELNVKQRGLDLLARQMIGAKGHPLTSSDRDRAMIVGPKIGRSDLAGEDLSLRNYFAVDAAVGEEKMKMQMDRQLHQSRVGILPHERDRLVKAREEERRAILSNAVSGGSSGGVGSLIGASAINVNNTSNATATANSNGIDVDDANLRLGEFARLPAAAHHRHLNSGHYTVRSVNERLSSANNAHLTSSVANKNYDPHSKSAPLATASTNAKASFLGYSETLRQGNASYRISGIGEVSAAGHVMSPAKMGIGSSSSSGAGGGSATSAAMGLVLGIGGGGGGGGMLPTSGGGVGGGGNGINYGEGLDHLGIGFGARAQQQSSTAVIENTTAISLPGERPRQATGSRYKYTTAPITHGSKPMKDIIFNSVLPPR